LETTATFSLASRDIVARAIITEINQGRGCGPNTDHVKLRVDHLGVAVVAKLLPGIREISKIFCGVDPAKEPIPVFPTAHYTMGGIPTDLSGRVVKPDEDGNESIVKGLYAAGECACASVHGANRLGGNSLLDILVFGRAAGQDIIDYVSRYPNHREMNETAVQQVIKKLQRWEQSGSGESVKTLRKEFQKIMEIHAGVFRTDELMAEGLLKIADIRARLQEARLSDHSKIFNTSRIAALELENLIDLGQAIAHSALKRTESRGAHSRPDYPKRDDQDWLKHSLYYLQTDEMAYKPVRQQPLSVESFPPKERVY